MHESKSDKVKTRFRNIPYMYMPKQIEVMPPLTTASIQEKEQWSKKTATDATVLHSLSQPIGTDVIISAIDM